MLIVEDIIDTGLTLNYLLRYLRGKNPRSLRICALLDKPARRLVEIPIDYRGFTIPDEFVVGYGLDFGEYYRNLPFIGVLRRELYESDMNRRALGRGRFLSCSARSPRVVGLMPAVVGRRADRPGRARRATASRARHLHLPRSARAARRA